MAIKKGKVETGGSKTEIPLEPTIGLLLSAVHVGQQRNDYDKDNVGLVDQVFIQFELQDVLTEKGTPITFGKLFRNSLHEKSAMIALAKALGANVEEGFDLEEHAGKPVMLNIEKNTKGNPAIKGYTKLRSADLKTVKPLMSTPKFLPEVEDISEAQKSELPSFVQKLITERVRTDNGQNPAATTGGVEL